MCGGGLGCSFLRFCVTILAKMVEDYWTSIRQHTFKVERSTCFRMFVFRGITGRRLQKNEMNGNGNSN